MRALEIIVAFLLIAAAAPRGGTGSGDEPGSGPPGEIYRYRSVPDGRAEDAERVVMEFLHGDTTIVLSRTDRPGGGERIEIRMEPGGELISASRRIVGVRGEVERADSIWREGETAWSRTEKAGEEDTREHAVPEGKPLAVDASLLFLLRDIPFDEEAIERDFFMIDFSGRSITVTARNRGTVQIEVPAGSFRCGEIEIEVNIFLIPDPTIDYWLSADEPHFMVRHEGKRGPFTPTYVTELLSMD